MKNSWFFILANYNVHIDPELGATFFWVPSLTLGHCCSRLPTELNVWVPTPRLRHLDSDTFCYIQISREKKENKKKKQALSSLRYHRKLSCLVKQCNCIFGTKTFELCSTCSNVSPILSCQQRQNISFCKHTVRETIYSSICLVILFYKLK